jgi:hypothetical protein
MLTWQQHPAGARVPQKTAVLCLLLLLPLLPP